MNDPISKLPSGDLRPWPIAIFAHNEAENIAECLDSLHAAAPGRRVEAFVLANGCTDKTEAVVENYARNHEDIHLVHIEIGDKCNAWNEFVHARAPRSEIVFFMDGDVQAAPDALNALHRGLSTHPEAHAAAALPRSGRSRAEFRRKMIEEGGVAGNLYALRGGFIDRLRDAAVHLPRGLVGDDSLVGALAYWDLDPRQGGWDRSRIATCPDAGFAFRPLSVYRPDHWRLYWRRNINYALRAQQLQMLAPLLRENGIEDMPATIQALYAARAHTLKLEWRGINSFFDILARRRIRKATPNSA